MANIVNVLRLFLVSILSSIGVAVAELLSSRRFQTASVAAFVSALISAVPALEPYADKLIEVIGLLAGVLIFGYTVDHASHNVGVGKVAEQTKSSEVSVEVFDSKTNTYRPLGEAKEVVFDDYDRA